MIHHKKVNTYIIVWSLKVCMCVCVPTQRIF